MKFLEKQPVKGDRNQEKDGESFDVSNSSLGENHKRTGSSSSVPVTASAPTLPNGCNECDHLQSGRVLREVTEVENSYAMECVKETVQEQKNDNAIQSSGVSVGGRDSSSSKGDNDLSAGLDCEIQWDDLQLGEVIGQGTYLVSLRSHFSRSGSLLLCFELNCLNVAGFFAKVYHGIWKGSVVS